MNKSEIEAAIKNAEDGVKAIDAKRESDCASLVAAFDSLKKEIDILEHKQQNLRAAICELERPSEEPRQRLLNNLRRLRQELENVKTEDFNSEARGVLLMGYAMTPSDIEVIKRVVKKHLRWSSDEVNVRLVKHLTHKVIAACDENSMVRFYFAYRHSDGKLCSVLISKGGGHRGAYVSVDSWGCREIESSRTRDGVPYYCKPENFTEWRNASYYKFSDGLTNEELEEMFKALYIGKK